MAKIALITLVCACSLYGAVMPVEDTLVLVPHDKTELFHLRASISERWWNKWHQSLNNTYRQQADKDQTLGLLRKFRPAHNLY